MSPSHHIYKSQTHTQHTSSLKQNALFLSFFLHFLINQTVTHSNRSLTKQQINTNTKSNHDHQTKPEIYKSSLITYIFSVTKQNKYIKTIKYKTKVQIFKKRKEKQTSVARSHFCRGNSIKRTKRQLQSKLKLFLKA